MGGSDADAVTTWHENELGEDARKRVIGAALLDWYRAAGVDAALSDAPVDWLARAGAPPASARALVAKGTPAPPPQSGARLPASARQPRPSLGAGGVAPPPAETHPQARAPLQPAIPIAPEEAVRDARAAAAEARSMAELRALLEAYDGCGLKATAKSLCFYRGAEQARVMIIGEAPGRDEDRSGIPFVGRVGQLLDKMLASIGLDESTTHITNVVYWRPPGNRTPTPVEIQVCRPFLERQITLAAPEIIVTVGGPATKALLDTTAGIMKVRGSWRDVAIAGRTLRLMPTLHPAYLLRTPSGKRLAWRDLLAIKAALDA